uniref:Large ribosomal subunit protein bL17m n=1 Tax=Romanomermis culicivorax TaxID=13658 RepID=A0A915J1F9_ROMCU
MVNARIKFNNYYRTFIDTVKTAKQYSKPLPTIPVTVPVKPYALKDGVVKTSEGRLIVIQKMLTSLYREERIDILRHQAIALRPYAERLIQIAIEYGNCHKETMELCNYWLLEKDLIQKLFNVYVPRFRNCPTAFTRMYLYSTDYQEVAPHRFRQHTMAVVELKGKIIADHMASNMKLYLQYYLNIGLRKPVSTGVTEAE